MIRTTGVTRRYGGRILFEDVDWFVSDRDRVGLVGPNGSGKSSWLKILAGAESPDAGRVELPKGQRLGYLPQSGYYRGEGTVREESRAAFSDVLALLEERQRLEQRLESTSLDLSEGEALLERLDKVEEEFRRRDGYEIDRQVDVVLRGLGFAPQDFDRPVPQLSGGWQMRVALARILLQRPDVLLLDEPTNFLDLEAREWLEGFLRAYPGSFVLVSHDRYFLDVTVDRITEVMSRELQDYTGNYTAYEKQRAARYEMALAAWERQQDEIKRVQVFIDRFRAKNTKASQVQSRIKMLEKMPKLERPVAPPKAIRFNFPAAERTGRIVLELQGVAKSYGETEVFRGVDLQLERGQQVALVGPNGAGKSTLLRILAGAEPFQVGTRTEGLRVQIDHFAQDAADRLPQGRTILDLAHAHAPVTYVPQIRSLLGAFLFRGEDVDKPVGVLSGGERSRLALALMLMRPANVLLLDEPTNHLDMQAQEVLLEAMRAFEGTIVFVSHDRAFIEGLATRVVEVGGGRLVDHPGDYESFLYKKGLSANGGDGRGDGGGKSSSKGRASRVAVVSEPAAETPSAAVASTGAPTNGGSGVSKPARKASRRRRELEERIAELEKRHLKIGAVLAGEELYRDAEKASFYLNEYREVAAAIETAMEEWGALSEE